VITNLVVLLERDIETLAGERDCSVESERCYALRREVSRISEILSRLSEMVETEEYETIDYVGPTRMIDLRAQKSQHTGDPRLKDVRVLVVDDDLGICRSLKEILEAEGCVVETAADGEQALSRIDNATFDVVLSDVVMPNLDGYALYTAMRARHPDVPVLMMTAFHYDKDHIIKRAKLEGLAGVIFKKPVDPQRLRDVLVETVTRRRGET
jgi:CheY-like chemotaxis protein